MDVKRSILVSKYWRSARRCMPVISGASFSALTYTTYFKQRVLPWSTTMYDTWAPTRWQTVKKPVNQTTWTEIENMCASESDDRSMRACTSRLENARPQAKFFVGNHDFGRWDHARTRRAACTRNWNRDRRHARHRDFASDLELRSRLFDWIT